MMEFPRSLAGAGPEEKDIPDSITLGQLKAAMASNPKPRQSMFDFRYEDEDTVSNEIEEFYSYVEMPQVGENLRMYQGSFDGEWMKSSPAQRRAYIEVLLESLEHRDAEVRFVNARRLFYVLQGTFAESTSPEHQLHWIIENCKLVRAANGTPTIIEALKAASSKQDILSNLSDVDTRHLNISAQEKADFLEEVNTELSVYFGMLYMLIEVFKGDEDFGEELMTMEPPFPIYLFGLISSLKEKSAKGYPVKKLLLLFWKTLLTCLGGIRELQRVKKLSRELWNLPPVQDSAAILKSSPLEFSAFRNETAVKYPTFSPPLIIDIPADKLAAALAPIPVRQHYHHSEDDQSGMPQRFPSQSQGPPQPPQPVTPAPTPPQSPKPKKQQYQTDQNRPFLFPFSRTRGQQRLVPFAIEEADNLYMKHMHVSLAIYQMWRTREDCILDESGLQSLPPSLSAEFGPGSSLLDRKYSVVSLPTNSFSHLTVEDSTGKPSLDDPEVALPDVVLLQDALKEAESKLRQPNLTTSERRKTKERKDDLAKLLRIETLYKVMLPQMQSWVIVLLKLLLATVTASGANPPSTTNSQFPSATSEAPPAPPLLSPEEIDVMRHREVTSKAVSAILILTLKWLKVSHVMKFQHLGQLLLDSNCLLLILKMFGLQEVSATVTAKHELPEQGFFRYCYYNHARNVQHRPEDNMLNPPRLSRPGNLSGGTQNPEEEVELITDYSWRNFFAAVNFIKVMQKLSKGRSHRIWLLVQYKSSAILKRILKVSHPMLQLHVLKLIKSQVPFCGRKWRQSNMKVITSIYLNCRPDLRDEWLTGTEVEDVSDALAQEQALRTLVKFYNTKRYGTSGIATAISAAHRRGSSHSVPQLEGLPPVPEIANMNRAGLSPKIDADVFPPLKSRAPDPSIFLPYSGEDIAFEAEYEEYLSDLGEEPSPHVDLGFSLPGQQDKASAWHRLANLPTDLTDAISDSESIVSIGDLGDVRGGDASSSDDGSSSDGEGSNSWEHMSPKTFKQMPKSPAGGGRRRSSGGGLRPVIPFGLDDGSALDEDVDDSPEMGPMPKERSTPFAAGEGGKGIDEVEYMYQE